MGVLYLRSYQGMGMFELSCVAGCTCEPFKLDGWMEFKASQEYHAAWPVSRSGAQAQRAWQAGRCAMLRCRAGSIRQGARFAWHPFLASDGASSAVAAFICQLPLCALVVADHPSALNTVSVHAPCHCCVRAEKCVIEARILNETTTSGDHKAKLTGVIVSEVAGQHLEVYANRIHVDFNDDSGVGEFEW